MSAANLNLPKYSFSITSLVYGAWKFSPKDGEDVSKAAYAWPTTHVGLWLGYSLFWAVGAGHHGAIPMVLHTASPWARSTPRTHLYRLLSAPAVTAAPEV
jgi:hypothetical protein